MAVFWVQDEQGQWEPVASNDDTVDLRGVLGPAVAPEIGAAAVVMKRGEERILISNGREGVWVNGEPLVLGIRALRDRDAIRIGARRTAFFSTEALPRITPFPQPHPAPCARCMTDVVPDSPAVKCPKCGAWHHQSDEFPCWTYTEKCARCDQPTALDGQYHWNPEGL